MRRWLLFTFCCSLFAQLPQGVTWSSQVINKSPAYPWDRAQLVAADSSGNIYVAGLTYSSGLPVTDGAAQPHFRDDGHCFILKGPVVPCADLFIAKYDPQGALIFLTYLGGSDGESLGALAADDSGVYVTGGTGSADFPVTASIFGASLQTTGVAGFLTKLSADGTSIVFSTLTDSNGLLASDGSALYFSTRVSAGCSISQLDRTTAAVQKTMVFARPCQAMAAGGDGSLVIAGVADAALPTTPGAWQTTFGGMTDGYVAKLSPSLNSILWTTFAGGSSDDVLSQVRIAVNSSGEVFLAGATRSNDFPTTPGAWRPTGAPQCTDSRPCGYLVRLSPDGGKALYSTYVPGYPAALAADSDGQVAIAGSAADLFAIPIGGPWPCAQTLGQTLWENYLMRFDAAGNPNWATWLGPSVPTDAVAVSRPSHVIAVGNIAPNSIFTRTLEGFQVPTISNVSMTPQPRLVSTCIQQTGAPYQRAVTLPGEPASEQSGVAPGELISIYGAGIGPQQGVVAPTTSLTIPSSLAGIQVFFDDVAAPLLYVSAGQINLVAPFEVSGKASTMLRIHSSAGDSPSLQIPVGVASPEILAVANSNATPNNAANPAHYGDNITIYASGAGLMTPQAGDGIVPVTAVRKIVQPLTVGLVYGPQVYAAEITYQGEAPFQVSGMVQINFRIPLIASPPGNSYDLQFVIGGAITYPAIIYVE